MKSYFDFDFERSYRGADPDVDIAILYFDPDSPIFKGHYPDYPIFPASLLCNFCLEALSDTKAEGLCIDNARFLGGIFPGDTIELSHKEISGSREFTFKSGPNVVAEISISKIKNLPELPDEAVDLSTPLHPAASFLPQSYPLIAIDLLGHDEVNGQGIARKFVSYSDYFFSNASPEDLLEATYPTGAVIEGIEQTASISLSRIWDMNDPDKVIQIAGLRGIKVVGEASPGERINFYTKVTLQSDNIATLTGYAEVRDRLLVKIDKIYVVRVEATA